MFVYVVDTDRHRVCGYMRELCLDTLPNLDAGKLVDNVPCTFNDNYGLSSTYVSAQSYCVSRIYILFCRA